MALTLSSELLDVVDADDKVVGVRTRGEVHSLRLMHRSVHVLVFNKAGHLLLQRRSMNKDECPGMWDSSCAGHVESGQSYQDTVPRELEEELGLVECPPLQELFKMPATEANGLEFAMVYRAECDGPFNYAEDEIDELEWFSGEQLDRWVSKTAAQTSAQQSLTSGFCEIWNKYRVSAAY